MRHDPEPLRGPKDPDAQEEAVEALEGTLEARMAAVRTKTTPEEEEALRRRMAALEIRLDLLQQKEALLRMEEDQALRSPGEPRRSTDYAWDPEDYEDCEDEPDEGKVIPQALARIRETIRETNKKAFEDEAAIVPSYIIRRLQGAEGRVIYPSSEVHSPSRFNFEPDPYTHREMLKTVSTDDLVSELVRRGAIYDISLNDDADVTGEAQSPENIDDQKEQR